MRTLVISDNPELTLFFQNEYEKQGLASLSEIDYAYSSYNKFPSSMMSLGAREVNVKDQEFCEQLILQYNLIISIHCKQIFPAELVQAVTCINLHPGLNPYNRGLYPQVFSIINKLPTGATLHLMDSEIDHGSIIAQREVKVISSDTSSSVYEKILAVEKDLIRENIASLINKNFQIKEINISGNYNSAADFKELCNLNLDSFGTLREHLDLLRALTHGDCKNAYFLDENNRKVFVRVSFEHER